MTSRADQIARLRVACSTGHLPPDLGRELLEVLVSTAHRGDRAEARNALLRQAAERITGSRWAKARRLEAEIAAHARGCRRCGGGDEAVCALVVAALEAAGPGGGRLLVRQLLRILECP
jgi:hypothetical protein